MTEPTGWELFYRVIRKIPAGRVATYGQIARIADRPRAARQVGYALNALRGRENIDVPWHRIVNAKGEISRRADPGCDDIQRSRLETEGIEFGLDGKIDLGRFGWNG